MFKYKVYKGPFGKWYAKKWGFVFDHYLGKDGYEWTQFEYALKYCMFNTKEEAQELADFANGVSVE